MSQSPPDPPPYVAPPSQAPLKTIAVVRPCDLWHWLRAAWGDLVAYPGIGAFYGAAFWAMALFLGMVFRARPEYAMTAASGCILLGPFIAMGLYDVSRRHALGMQVEFTASLTCWRPHMRSMGMLMLVLIVLELLWGRASLVVFAVFFNTGMPSTTGVLQAIFNPENWDFVLAYTAVGGVFAVITFAIAVVSIPAILDRDVDAITAAITSVEVVFNNTAVMVLWGGLISILVVLAMMLPWAVGLLLVGPLMGHASWHAYRGVVQWMPEAPHALT